MITLALSEYVFDELRAWLDLEVETAGVLVARAAQDGELLLARALHPVPSDAYRERTMYSLNIASGGYVPALRGAADNGEVACFIHSHPGGSPLPSTRDDAVDDEFRRLFPSRTGQIVYPTLIIGGTADAPQLWGRVFDADGGVRPLERFRVAGRRIRLFVPGESSASAIFDRHVRAFGAEGQELLEQLRVGVVGAGGTGSALIEELIRLGVGRLLIADDDVVTGTNLTRIHQSKGDDIGSSKVDVVARLAGEIKTGSRVERILGRVTQEEVAREFATCDVIFGCTDDHAGRAVLSRLAYWYLIPVIDMGVVIDSTDGVVAGIYGRVTSCGPGSACLVCRGVVDPIQMRDEMLTPEERTARVAEGYAPELADPDPAVVAYTSLTASFALAEFLNRLFGIGDPVDDMRIRVHERDVRAIAGQPTPGHYCSERQLWAQGDSRPFLDQTW